MAFFSRTESPQDPKKINLSWRVPSEGGKATPGAPKEAECHFPEVFILPFCVLMSEMKLYNKVKKEQSINSRRPLDVRTCINILGYSVLLTICAYKYFSDTFEPPPPPPPRQSICLPMPAYTPSLLPNNKSTRAWKSFLSLYNM